MGRWTSDEYGCIYDETGCFARLTPNKAERLASRHNADIDALTAERDRLAAENAELRAEKNYAEVDANKYRAAMMVANATLGRLREVWQKHKSRRDEFSKEYRDKLECEYGAITPMKEDFRAILYPKETKDA